MLVAQAEMGWLEAELVRLFDLGAVGLLGAAGLLVASLAIGAAHALAPGHGKAVIAAYLVGERGRPRDAAALGAVVAVMHTASVLAVGVGIYLATRASAAAGRFAEVDQLSAWMTVSAGALVLAVGVGMLVRQLRRRRARRRLAVGARGRPEATAGRDAHGHLHALPAGVPPLSRRGLVLLGTSGGLLPSPSAFLVLTTGLFTGRTVFALLMVFAFSLGLAATLTAIGLAVVWGHERQVGTATSSARLARLTGAVPLASAVAVTAGGAAMTGLALARAL